MKGDSRSKSIGRRATSVRASKRSKAVTKGRSSLPTLEEGRRIHVEAHRRRSLGAREDVHFQFTTTVTQFSRRWRNRLNERLAVLGQTQARVESLFWIEVAGGKATQRELAERVGIEGPTFARMLDRLEEEGLVERRVSSEDRRTKTIALKQHAVPDMRRIAELMSRARNELLGDIDPAQLATVISVMRTLMAKLERR